MSDSPVRTVRILYRNYKETAWRTIAHMGAPYFDSNQWHPEPQWLMNATDVEKGELRTFALKDILRWQNTEGDKVPPLPPSEQERVKALAESSLEWSTQGSMAFTRDTVSLRKSAPCGGGRTYQYIELYERDVPTLIAALKQQFPKQFAAEKSKEPNTP